MCGIAAIYGDSNPEIVRRMTSQLCHRGPDDDGVYCDNNISLGHTRLSIVDVEHGHQPLFNEDGSIVLICNGEIYNHLQLREKLGRHAFSTRSDSEVILHLYEELGPECVRELDGMFAFILFDGKNLFAARDPIGIKPLYHGKRGDNLCFASEMKAFSGLVEDISEFPNGSYYHSEEGFQPYYELPQTEPQVDDAESAAHHLRELFQQAVVKRLMADVPLGVLLSGGLDSSLVSAMASKHADNLNSFSVGMSGSADVMAARTTADFIGTHHHEFVYTMGDVLEALPTVIYYLESYDAPLVRSAVPTFFVSRLARRHVKVILSGEGADELFAGYHYYKNCPSGQLLHQELVRSVASLHNLNLQRLDRLSMAHSLEARVPFLDVALIEYALQLSPALKIEAASQTEKWILRKAFEDMLPREIVWRVKQQFAEGCGSAELISDYVESFISDEEYHTALAEDPRCRARSKEELYYYRIFSEHFGNESAVGCVGHWEETY